MLTGKLLESTRTHLLQVIRRSYSDAVRNRGGHDQKGIGIVGAAWGGGQRHEGVSNAPKELREFGLLSNLQDLGYSVHDYGDITVSRVEQDDPPYRINHPRTCGKVFKLISEAVHKAVDSQRTCVTLGGDHSVAMGTIVGHAQAKPDLCVVWVDAHADLNPPQTSPTGNVHGMPLSFLLHEMAPLVPTDIPGLEWIKPCVKAQNLAYIGLRDIDKPEKYLIEKLGIPCYTMRDIDEYGINHCIQSALKAINPRLDRPIHLSFDVDSVDPSLCPSTGTPVPGGLTMREAIRIVEVLSSTGCLSAMDLVEVNTELGSAADKRVTLSCAMEILMAVFGKRKLGTIPQDYVVPSPNQTATFA